MSIIVFSERRRAAPSLIIRRAAVSSILPSTMKCCFSTSGRGDPVRSSKTSATVILCDGGNGTSVDRDKRRTVIPLKFIIKQEEGVGGGRNTGARVRLSLSLSLSLSCPRPPPLPLSFAKREISDLVGVGGRVGCSAMFLRALDKFSGVNKTAREAFN